MRIINGLPSESLDVVKYLEQSFLTVLEKMHGPGMSAPYEVDQASRQRFLDAVERRVARGADSLRSLAVVRAMLQERGGVVVNTCHGLKGEEFDTVIAFGMLRGYIPFWKEIFNTNIDDGAAAMRLLYVTCSRAKMELYLVSERGRTTTNGTRYEPTYQLANVHFNYG